MLTLLAHTSPQALQRVLGPFGPRRIIGVDFELIPQWVHLQKAKDTAAEQYISSIQRCRSIKLDTKLWASATVHKRDLMISERNSICHQWTASSSMNISSLRDGEGTYNVSNCVSSEPESWALQPEDSSPFFVDVNCPLLRCILLRKTIQ